MPRKGQGLSILQEGRAVIDVTPAWRDSETNRAVCGSNGQSCCVALPTARRAGPPAGSRLGEVEQLRILAPCRKAGLVR